jgi:hypothetical protein
MAELPTVVMMKDAVDQKGEAQDLKVVDTKLLKSSALFKDWKEKFRHTPMFAVQKPGVQLEQVEDVPDDDEGFEEMDDAQAGDEEWEDEEDEEEGEGEPMDLDPEALKHAIAQNLKAAGISTKGMDEQTIMAMAMKMFSGGEGADDLIGELADQLLGGKKGDSAHEEEDEATEDEEAGFAGWVQKQAEQKAAKKTQEHDLPTPTDSLGKPSASPPDKRAKQKKGIEIEADVEVEANVGAENDLVVEKRQGTKRKAESVTELEVGTFKKAARRFDAPTAASKARAASGSAPVPATAKRKGRKG